MCCGTAVSQRERQEDMLKLSSRVKTIEEDADDLGTMIRAIRKNRGGEGVYLVTHSDATQGLMEITPLAYARIEAAKRDIDVLGVAKSRENALELVRCMVEEMAKSGNFTVSGLL